MRLFSIQFVRCASCCLLLWLLLVSSGPALAQTIRYVKPVATGTATGSSWANASGNLQAMINASTTPTQIWVATGVYTPGTNRGDSFAMKNNVAIYGGFAGSETALTQRVLTSPSNTTLSGNSNNYHVIRNPVGLTTTALIDGFVITGGNASASTFPDNSGGGMFNNGKGAGNSCSPLVRNCLFQVNIAENGGAIYNDGSSGGNSSPVLANCLFERNLSTHALAIGTGGGGAIYNNGNGGNANFSLTNCSFLSNRAINGEGGAIYNNCFSGNARASLTNCSFQANRAKNLGWTIFNDGSTANTGPTLTNCVLWDISGGNTFRTSGASKITVRYSLFDSRSSTIYYTDVVGNLKVTSSPFPSTTDTRLPANSLANNVGDPATTTATVGATDLAGNPRISGGRIDMGAYEFQIIPEVISLKNGSWTDISLWSVGRLPLAGERVRLRHSVTIPASYTALGGRLLYDPLGKIIYAPGGRLRLGP